MRRSVVALLALNVLACSGSPTAPSVPVVSTPQPVTVSARDGITGQPVTASVQQNGSMVTVTAPGYLVRSQPTAPAVYLWQQPEDYVRTIVYTISNTGAVRPLVRWRRGVRAAMAAGLERHEPLLRDMVAEVNRVTRLGLTVSPTGQPAEITVRVDPSRVSSSADATTSIATDSTYGLVSADIFFARESDISDPRDNILLHELGHAVGLGHSDRPDDIMSTRGSSNRSFTDAESRALTMMYSWRKAGNTYPDNEPQGLALSRPHTYTIACH